MAFVLQAAYTILMNRHELIPGLLRRRLGILVVAGGVLAVTLGGFVVVYGYGGPGQAYSTLLGTANETGNAGQRLASLDISSGRLLEGRLGGVEGAPLTGTGAGTFQYTWLEDRPGLKGVKQVHNVYLEQGTETGLFAFLALLGFVAVLVGYTGRAVWRSGPQGERRLLLAGLCSALVVYLVSSAFEWHWYLPASTLLLYPRRRRSEVRLQGGLGCRRGSHRRQWG